MRLIDADALIAEYDRVHVGAPGGARKLMVDAPTIEPERKWIPCSERLPNESDYIGVAECIDGAVWYYTDKGAMGLGYYYESTKAWSTTYDEEPYGNVIAWMPLPEPYKAERREDG